jgi:hypothetical protein
MTSSELQCYSIIRIQSAVFVTDSNRFAFPGFEALHPTNAFSIQVLRSQSLHSETPLQDIRCIRLHYVDGETLSEARGHISDVETGSQS